MDVGCHFLLQMVFPAEGLNPCILHCRWILLLLSHQGYPTAFNIYNSQLIFSSAYVYLRLFLLLTVPNTQEIVGALEIFNDHGNSNSKKSFHVLSIFCGSGPVFSVVLTLSPLVIIFISSKYSL